jgi:Putative peptidoglycan binding domain
MKRPYIADILETIGEFDFEEDGFETEFAEAWQDEVNRTSRNYIRWVQSSLNRIMGLRLAEDGIIGSQTRSAIRSFQQQRGLTVDGIVGSHTERALIAAGAGSSLRAGATSTPTQKLGAKGGDREVGETLAMTAKKVPGLGITLEELLLRHKADSGDIPIEVLLAFIHFEAGTRLFDDATAGKWNEKYQKYSPSFYELGVFQTPAGDHGCIREGGKRMCKHEAPGYNVKNSQFGKGWYRLTQTFPTKNNWKDPTMQVRIGLWDLNSTGERVAKAFAALFPSRRSEWYLRMAVLYSFSKGAGWARAFLNKYKNELLALPESQRWDFLRGKPAYLKGHGTKTFDPENVDRKMSLAAKLGAVRGATVM